MVWLQLMEYAKQLEVEERALQTLQDQLQRILNDMNAQGDEVGTQSPNIHSLIDTARTTLFLSVLCPCRSPTSCRARRRPRSRLRRLDVSVHTHLIYHSPADHSLTRKLSAHILYDPTFDS
jgi:hypothetical protein